MTLETAEREKIESIIQHDRIVLFMKGTAMMPQCGFSATVVRGLEDLGVAFKTVNVLSDPQLRDGIKKFSEWPTIPQLYIDGEFIGGCDIVKEMLSSGQLQEKLGVSAADVVAPHIEVTAAACEAIKDAASDDESLCIHVRVDPKFHTGLEFGAPTKYKVEVEVASIRFFFDAASAKRSQGLKIDFDENGGTGGFRIHNPNAPQLVEQIVVSQVQEWLDANKEFHLIDVRTTQERETARIEAAAALPEVRDELDKLDRKAVLVFHCHHGGRSQKAAEHYASLGFTNVYNMTGGIDAWSQEIDSNVPRY